MTGGNGTAMAVCEVCFRRCEPAEGRTGAELAAFSNAVSSAIAKFEKNREQSIALVSAQMRGANDEKLKQKGK